MRLGLVRRSLAAVAGGIFSPRPCGAVLMQVGGEADLEIRPGARAMAGFSLKHRVDRLRPRSIAQQRVGDQCLSPLDLAIA